MPAQFEKIARALLQAFDKAGVTATAERRRPSPERRLPERRPEPRGGGAALNCPATSMPAEQYQLTPDALAVTRCVAHQFATDHHHRHLHRPRPRPHPRRRHHDPQLPDGDRAERSACRSGTGCASTPPQLGVDYLIWNEQIWSTKRAREGWRQCGTAAATCYTGPDDSAGHRNHVHVSVFGTSSVEYANAHGGDRGRRRGGLSARRRPRPRQEEPERLRRRPGLPEAPGHDQLQAVVPVLPRPGCQRLRLGPLRRRHRIRSRRHRQTGREDAHQPHNIPRGAVCGGPTAVPATSPIYDGAGFIYSNDAVIHGEVSRVRWDLPEKQWGQHFEGWSAPYFPHAGGSVA